MLVSIAELNDQTDSHGRFTGIEAGNLLRNIVFQDPEILPRNIRNEMAFVVQHRHVYVDDIGLHFETRRAFGKVGFVLVEFGWNLGKIRL